MKLSVSAFRAQASAQRKILPSYQNQLNYGTCSKLPAVGGYKLKEKFPMMVDSTGISPTNGPQPGECPECSETSTADDDDTKGSVIIKKQNEKEDAPKPSDTVSNHGKKEEILPLEKSTGKIRSKSNQRWMKLRTTVQLSGAINSTNQKSKSPLKREDSFLKRFSTRQIPETQETVDTCDETETLNGSQAQSEVNRRRRKRQKEISKTVVNPDENFYFYWLMTVTICVLYNLWTLIVRQSFPELQNDASSFWYFGDGLTDVVFICDIVVQFRTGYLEQGLMVYNSKKLAIHYLKSRAFILDILSLLPLDFLQLNIGVNPILRFPRFLKIYRVYNYYYMVESRTVYPNLWRVVNLIHILLILAHWFGCFYYLLSEAEGFQGDWVYPYHPGEYATLTRKYLGSLYWSTLTLTTIGDLPTPETNAESLSRSKAMTTSEQSEGIPRRGHKSRLLQFKSNYGYLFTIISYLIGVFIFATIVGQVGNVITNRNANRLEFERLLDGAKTYMRHHKVPGGMKRRVLRWYDYSWSRGRIQGGGDINTALGLLPDKLKTELALHVNLSVLKKVTIFQECQPEFLHDLVLKMKAYIFTPGDLICRKGEVAREMFIIADGILDVISETGRVLTTMKAGDFFGEIGILNLDGLNKRTADVRSVGYSELFSLSREDVLTAMKDYPEAQEILQSLGRKRLMEAKNASKSLKAQFKEAKDYGSSGDSDNAGKRIVEKLRSDVKGLKNVLRRSRRHARNKDTFERAGENLGRKISTKNHSTLRRMSHVQSSDEYEANNDVDRSPIGAGHPLLQRLKMLKEKQEKERNKSILCGDIQTKKDVHDDAESTGPSLPFAQKLKLLRQKEAKESSTRASAVVSSTVRTQVTGFRFEKSTPRTKTSILPKKTEEKTYEEVDTYHPKKKEWSEIGIFTLKEKLKLVQANQGRERVLATKSPQNSGTSSTSKFNFESKSETPLHVPPVREAEGPLSKILGNTGKVEGLKSKEAWKLLKKSSFSSSNYDRKFRDEENKSILKISKKRSYLSKSDTVLFKQKPMERDNEKQSRLPSNEPNSQKKIQNHTAENLMKERKRSRSVGHSPKLEKDKDESKYWDFFSATNPMKTPLQKEDFKGVIPQERNSSINIQKMMKMKKYNSISDLSPEYSGLPFVKKLKILNERQKLEELEKELLVKSVSLDVPERPTSNNCSVLVRSQSEASAIDFKNVNSVHFQTELEAKMKYEELGTSVVCNDESVRPKPKTCLEFRKVTKDEKKLVSRIHLEGIIASPESNETIERKHLRSILKKLSAGDSTSDEDSTKELTSKKGDNIDLKKLMRAPTMEGYAARHKKLTKSVTFDSDTLPSSPDPVSDQPADQNKENGFSPVSPTAILTLQLSNLSMIPIVSPKKTTKNEERRQIKQIKYTDREEETTRIWKTAEEGHTFQILDIDKENLLTPYALKQLIEKKFRVSPFFKGLGDEFLAEFKAVIFQVLQQVLEEILLKIKFQFCGLQTEIQNKEQIIVQLQSKICELERKSFQFTEKKNGAEIFEPNANGRRTDFDVLDVPLPREGSFETIRGMGSSSAESLCALMPPISSPAEAKNSFKARENYSAAVSQSNDFTLDTDFPQFPANSLNKKTSNQDEVDTKIRKCHYSTLESLAARNVFEQTFRTSPSDEEEELVELLKFCPSEFGTKKYKLNRNFSTDETPAYVNLSCKSHEGELGQKPKEGLRNQETGVQRSFSCSLNKTSDFVALNIDESSHSSDDEDLDHKDWEVQLLAKELARKDSSWKTEEEGIQLSEKGIDVEHISNVRKLQKEVNTLKHMVSESYLTRITASELDILKNLVEAKDKKISLLAKSSSFDNEQNRKRRTIHKHVCSSTSTNKLKNSDQKKKLWLRQKIGQAFSFDFHDIENRKPKSPDCNRHGPFYLRKQKTTTDSRKEHKNLRHTSIRLRNKVLEDSDRVIKGLIIGRSSAANSMSNLPILDLNLLPREKTCDMRMSLPLLSAKELQTNFPKRLSSFEEGHQVKNDYRQSCDSVFKELELLRQSDQKRNRDFGSSRRGSLRQNDHHPGNNLNNFIRSVGQKMRQVLVSDVSNIRNQVPTISKLCENQPILKEAELDVSDSFDRGTEVPPDENNGSQESQTSKIFDS